MAGKFRLADGVARALGRSREEVAKRSAPSDPLLDQEPPSVVKMVDDVLRARAEKRPYFRPSMVGGCMRQNVLHYHGAPSNPSYGIDPKFHRLLDTGTLTHKVVQDYLAEHPGIFFVPEVPVWYPTLNIKGHSDGLMVRRSDGYRFCLEIKTKTHDGFTKLTKPEAHHVGQASIYARLMGVKWIVLLYWDRDKNHMREFPVKALASWNEVVERVKALQAWADGVKNPYAIKDDELPPFQQAVCDASWDFCQFSDFCFHLRGEEPRRPSGRFF